MLVRTVFASEMVAATEATSERRIDRRPANPDRAVSACPILGSDAAAAASASRLETG